MSLNSLTSASPAATAFDAIAEVFDARFGAWASVAAQRRAVRAALAEAFPVGAHLLEIGGGTGEDAVWLLDRGRQVLMTDAAPAMVRIATEKFDGRPGAKAEVAPAEGLGVLADRRERAGEPLLDGAYSNFAALNCVADLTPFARGLARLVRVGAPVILVVFGALCPGEMIVEGLCGRPRNMFRRLTASDAPARLGGNSFVVRYHRAGAIRRALSPWFEFQQRKGVGVFVPPSAAEPWISSHPRLLSGLEALDRALSSPLAVFGDHVLYKFVRTDAEGPGA